MITALPFVLGSSRVLVVVPSNIVRRQVALEFQSLRTLKNVAALPRGIKAPKRKALKHGIRSKSDWKNLAGYDVIIATPQCVSTRYKGIVPPPEGFFDLLVVDEAHHSPAETWNQVLEDLTAVPAALLTATPFRRDKRRLPGEIAFWYPLRDAIVDGIYSPIEFVPVKRSANEDADLTLARAGKKQIDLPRHKSLGSLILVRTDRIDDAYKLQGIYKSIGLSLPVLTSRLSNKETDTIVASLEEGTVAGVIVVGVLTEGFDLPRLKLAIYHRKHKSLASTLQFVGRLARTTDDLALQPELLAFADELTDETTELYREDASWSDLLPQIADTAVESEKSLRDYIAAFEGAPKDFSLVVVEPTQKAQIFVLPKARSLALSAKLEELVRSPVVDYFVDSDEELAAFVTREIVHPDWLRSSVYDTNEYYLHVVCVDRKHRFVFVKTSSDASVKEILKHYGLEDLTPVSPSQMNQVLHSYHITDYSTIGLRNNRPTAAEGNAYTTLAGHSAARGITPMDEVATSTGHVSARYMSGTTSATIGTSLDNAKVWESGRCSLYDFRIWCNDLAEKLDGKGAKYSFPPGLNVPIRSELKAYPRDAIAVAMTFPLYDGEFVWDDTTVSAASTAVRVRSTPQSVIIGIEHKGCLLGTYHLDLKGGVTNRRGNVQFKTANYQRDLGEALGANPPLIFFADGNTAYRNTICKVAGLVTQVPHRVLQRWAWDGTDPRRESKPPRKGFEQNIQRAAISKLRTDHPEAFIVVDDAANEVADLIVLRSDGPHVFVDFVHCKWSSKDEPGHRLEDIYQVLSQVARCVRWTKGQIFFAELLRRLEERSATRLEIGDLEKCIVFLRECISRPPTTLFGQIAVQPGTQISGIETWPSGSSLLASCFAWCEVNEVEFTFCGS